MHDGKGKDLKESVKTKIQSMNLKEHLRAWENVLSKKETLKVLAPDSSEEDRLKCREFFRLKIEKGGPAQI